MALLIGLIIFVNINYWGLYYLWTTPVARKHSRAKIKSPSKTSCPILKVMLFLLSTSLSSHIWRSINDSIFGSLVPCWMNLPSVILKVLERAKSLPFVIVILTVGSTYLRCKLHAKWINFLCHSSRRPALSSPWEKEKLRLKIRSRNCWLRIRRETSQNRLPQSEGYSTQLCRFFQSALTWILLRCKNLRTY